MWKISIRVLYFLLSAYIQHWLCSFLAILSFLWTLLMILILYIYSILIHYISSALFHITFLHLERISTQESMKFSITLLINAPSSLVFIISIGIFLKLSKIAVTSSALVSHLNSVWVTMSFYSDINKLLENSMYGWNRKRR